MCLPLNFICKFARKNFTCHPGPPLSLIRGLATDQRQWVNRCRILDLSLPGMIEFVRSVVASQYEYCISSVRSCRCSWTSVLRFTHEIWPLRHWAFTGIVGLRCKCLALEVRWLGLVRSWLDELCRRRRLLSMGFRSSVPVVLTKVTEVNLSSQDMDQSIFCACLIAHASAHGQTCFVSQYQWNLGFEMILYMLVMWYLAAWHSNPDDLKTVTSHCNTLSARNRNRWHYWKWQS